MSWLDEKCMVTDMIDVKVAICYNLAVIYFNTLKTICRRSAEQKGGHVYGGLQKWSHPEDCFLPKPYVKPPRNAGNLPSRTQQIHMLLYLSKYRNNSRRHTNFLCVLNPLR